MSDRRKDACSVTGHGKDEKDYSGFESNVGGLEKLERQGTGAPLESSESCAPLQTDTSKLA